MILLLCQNALLCRIVLTHLLSNFNTDCLAMSAVVTSSYTSPERGNHVLGNEGIKHGW